MFYLGQAYADSREFDKALEWFLKATAAQPSLAPAWRKLGDTYFEMDRWEDSMVAYRKANQLDPRDRWVSNRIAWISATAPDEKVRNPEAALKMAGALAQQTGRQDCGVLEVLSAAQASVGQFDEAIATAEEALQLAEDNDFKSSQTKLKAYLAHFRAKKTVEPKTGMEPEADSLPLDRKLP
jgi:tetratricopeptide (TPR) repeat protein